MVSTNGNEPSVPDLDEDDLDLDLDLDAEDAVLTAKIGEPTRVKITGHVITIPHMDWWDYEASRAMSSGNFTGWAASVLSEDDFKIWREASLKNYQIEAIVAKVTMKGLGKLAGGNGLGKSQGRSASSARRRKR